MLITYNNNSQNEFILFLKLKIVLIDRLFSEKFEEKINPVIFQTYYIYLSI